MPDIKTRDYVIAVEKINNIPKNSVGIVRSISMKGVKVFFVGKATNKEVGYTQISYLDIKKTGKPYSKKICNICHILKDMAELSINQTDAKGQKTTRPSCKTCRVEIDGMALKPEEQAKLDAIKPKDIFTCPICKKTTIVGVTANLVRDHDHKTGKARAWICDSCNTGLGRFKDDVRLLEDVITYLKRFESKG